MSTTTETTPAQRFVDQYRDKVEDAIETMVGECYEKEIEGAPSRHSQYGVVYETVEIRIDTRMSPESSVRFLVNGMASWLKQHPGKVIVWRVRPILSTHAEDTDLAVPSETGVRLRFRAHVLGEIPECLP